MSIFIPKAVFISYSTEDQSDAFDACNYLEGKGISCWIAPRNIVSGENYATQIVSAIRNCTVFVLVVSASTNTSEHVTNEVSLAFDNKKKIIPFKLENIAFSDELTYYLNRKHWIEAYSEFPLGLEQLYVSIAGELDNLKNNSQVIENDRINFQEERKNPTKCSIALYNEKHTEQKYTVLGFNDLVSADISIENVKNEILALVGAVMSGESNANLKRNLEMLEEIRENWKVIVNQDLQVVGFWIFVALPDELYEKAIEGKLDESTITLDNIEYIEFPGTYNGYLLSSGLNKESRSTSLVQMLYNSFAIHLQELAVNKIFLNSLCAVAESPTGRSTMRGMGMVEVCKHERIGTVFQCDFSKIRENPFFSQFEYLVGLYEEHSTNHFKSNN